MAATGTAASARPMAADKAPRPTGWAVTADDRPVISQSPLATVGKCSPTPVWPESACVAVGLGTCRASGTARARGEARAGGHDPGRPRAAPAPRLVNGPENRAADLPGQEKPTI